ncbi:MAG TPA: hypothetical protein VFU80_08985 [Sphingomicrobium sp.]|nr:hypothetical protein [Sphingomicrobium sp.]
MKWGRPTDYHGSRTYEPDEAAADRFNLLDGLTQLARRVLSFGTRPSSSKVLLADGERHFSILGTSSRRRRREKAADCPFPTGPTTAHNDWRVLP